MLAFWGVQAVPALGHQDSSKQMSKDMEALFESKVRPTIQTKCYGCHGPKQQIADLRLDKPLTPAEAKLVAEAISYTGDTKMPPSGKLPVDELAAVQAWAKAGAPWPSTKAPEKPKGKFWAFVAPTTPPLPTVKAKWWAQNPIDTFVLAKLEEHGLKPAPPADRRTLIRRATFDLTGLPPTPKEIDDFLKDQQPNAFERVIDRLMATPAYGERWGRHWLDVARYADSNGLDENLVYPNAWRYRDWVINALNADMPIDRFFQEQLAGDLMPNTGDDGIVATGFLSLGGKMLAEDDPVKQEMDIIDEQVDTTSKTFMALTVGCARCHDHKFDPISAHDYYALAGIFKSTRTMLNFKVVAEWNERMIGPKDEQEKLTKIQGEIKTKNDEATKERKAASEELLKALNPRTSDYEKAARTYLEGQKHQVALNPVISTPDGKAPSDAIVHEAEDFISGNVKKDLDGFGKGIGVLVNIGNFPNRTDYEITVPAAGPYQLDLRYAAGDARPIRVYANDTLVLSDAAGKVTGGFQPQHQQWQAGGIILLKAGSNTIRFERDSYFPHIDKFLLIARPGTTPTENLGTLAKQNGLIPELVKAVADKITNGAEIKIELPEDPDHLFPAPVQASLKELKGEVDALEKSKPNVPLAMAVGEGKPTDLKLHIRGNYLTLGEDCPRRFPTVVSEPNQPAIPTGHSGRLELAQWLTSPKNPLTARVFVNRVWRWKFGRGIVGSVDNFGALGDLPTHPELLDWLATTFVNEDKWSLKKLQKRLMLTNTYIMSGQYDAKSAEIDLDNHFLWRFPRQRLEAEEIRDSILAVAGTLDRKMGGTEMSFKPRAYVTSTESSNPLKYDSPRRAIYLPVIRAAVYDVYTAFDFGDPTVMNGDRSSTTVAPQALFMLNSPLVLSATKTQAEKLMQEPGLTDADRVKELYVRCYARPASDSEVARALDFLNKFESAYAQAKDPKLSAWQSLCKSIIAANEFIYVE
ncbi:MAG: DUF1549 domain-containing protein [Armatimonadetes bacterium]|nr:DUF1549 domain-containing protein [Armatimonadota bacterium]